MSCIKIVCTETGKHLKVHSCTIYKEPHIDIDIESNNIKLFVNTQVLNTLITPSISIVCAFAPILSCFGSGKWVGSKPWLGKELWKNN